MGSPGKAAQAAASTAGQESQQAISQIENYTSGQEQALRDAIAGTTAGGNPYLEAAAGLSPKPVDPNATITFGGGANASPSGGQPTGAFAPFGVTSNALPTNATAPKGPPTAPSGYNPAGVSAMGPTAQAPTSLSPFVASSYLPGAPGVSTSGAPGPGLGGSTPTQPRTPVPTGPRVPVGGGVPDWGGLPHGGQIQRHYE